MASVHDSTPQPSNESNQSLLIVVDKVAALLAIGERQVWRRVSSDELPKPIRIGGSTRWRLKELEDWVAAGCPTPVSKWKWR